MFKKTGRLDDYDAIIQEQLTPLNAKAPVFRPRRDAAVAANLRIRDAIESEEL